MTPININLPFKLHVIWEIIYLIIHPSWYVECCIDNFQNPLTNPHFIQIADWCTWTKNLNPEHTEPEYKLILQLIRNARSDAAAKIISSYGVGKVIKNGESRDEQIGTMC